MLKSAKLSPCRKYRYTLSRVWRAQAPKVLFIGLNPSTADEKIDDPTIRRCMGYARDWGYGGVLVANLFAYRARQPADLRAVDDPVGPHNDYWLCSLASQAGLVVAAWGNHATYRQRWKEVVAMFDELYCLEVTQQGQPRHPLYARKELLPGRWHPNSI